MATNRKKSTTARKTTARKTPGRKPATAKKSTPVKNPVKDRPQINNKIIQEAVILVILALSVIFFLANLGLGGIVGAGISSFFFGLFGLTAYIFPILLFIGTIFGMSNKNNSVARIKLIASVFAMIFLCTFIQLVSGNHADEWKFTDYYYNSSFYKNGGGFFGGSLCKLFCTWFGVVGAYIFDIVLIIICGVIISEHSFLGGVRKNSQKVYDTARYDVKKYKEDVAVKRKAKETHRLERAARKVRGVAYDTEIPKDELEFEPDDVHEINPEELIGEEIFDFTPAGDNEKPLADRRDRFSDDILPFEEDRYSEVVHYEEEQSSPFEPYTEILPQPVIHSEDSGVIDTDLIKEEYNKEHGSIPADHAPSYSDKNVDDIDIDRAVAQIVNDETPDALKGAEPEAKAEPEPVVPAKPKPRKKKYVFPPLNLLKRGGKSSASADSKEELRRTAMKLQQTLANFGVKVTVTDVSCGPAVTRYEIQPEQGVKVSKIVSLADDIKLNLAAADIRIEAPIPGKAAVGIEVPNKENSGVLLGDLICSDAFRKSSSKIAFSAGKDIAGQTVIADIAKMPHLLIAGATGSGKSVCINTIIMSILYKASPDDVKLIMVDPKVVELSVYNGIPHLLIPVVTDPKKAAGALNWAVAEMTDRYQKFAQYGVRDMKGYNEKVESIADIEDENKPVRMPQIVIIIDELADLMMVSSNEVEDAIVRLAQLARAAGIHLVIATQRPSVNVITGLIKANVPSRIAFSVSSGVDSRTIIDMNGAEKLLGKGDMLFYPQGYQKPARVQGAFVSDEEVSAVVEFIKNHCDETQYSEEVTQHISNPGFAESQTFGGDQDQYFAEAGKFIIEKERASIGMLQRVYKIGFNRAARIMDQLCEAGVVGPEEGTKPRKVLMTVEEFEEYLRNN